jgi:hypothetical protein
MWYQMTREKCGQVIRANSAKGLLRSMESHLAKHEWEEEAAHDKG